MIQNEENKPSNIIEVSIGDAGKPEQPDLSISNNEPPAGDPPSNEPPANEPPVGSEPQNNNTSQTPVFNEEGVLSFLKEKLGAEFTSLEDLKPKEVTPLDPELQAIVDWKNKTGRPLNEWIDYSQDFSKLSDVEVIKRMLKQDYPTLTEEQINLELSLNYVESEDDMDNDKAIKNLKLAKEATKGRERLNASRLELGQPGTANYPKEVQEDLQLATQVKQQFAADKQNTELYNAGLQKASGSFDKLPLKLSDTLTIDYVVPAEEKGYLPKYVNEMPHWKNADGSTNHEAIVADAARIKNFDHLIKMAYEQGLASGKEAVTMAASNVTLHQTPAAAANPNANKGFEIIGGDKMLTGNTLKVR